jgi:hypothetical protein
MTKICMTIDIEANLDDGVSIEDAIESMNVTMIGADVDIVNSSVDHVEE